MARRKFDCYMVQVGMGTHPKFARLTDAEFRCHVAGVLAIAATSPVRGCLFVGEQEAEAIDVSTVAGVSEKIAASCIEKLKAVGVLVRDDEMGCWCVHDWADLNPEPKTDATAAERSARYRERRRQRHASVTPASRRDARDDHGAVTTPEVEVGITPPQPPSGGSGSVTPPPGNPPVGGRGRTRTAWEAKAEAFAAVVLPHRTPREAYGILQAPWRRVGYDAPPDQLIAWLRIHQPQWLVADGDQERGAA